MFKLIILGCIQGFTEFLPVSSSAHLAVLEKIFGLTEQGLEISIILHLGTLFSIFVFFYKDILKVFKKTRIFIAVVIVTIITGTVGFLGKAFFENLFASIKVVSLAWIASGVMLLCTRGFMHGKKANVNFIDSVILGFTQSIAIIPGISRSGVTISTMLFRGIDKLSAFHFSFLISIPAILGAVLLEAKEIGFVIKADFLSILLGFVCSFISGLIALWILKKLLEKAKFYYFGYYCLLAAVITFIFVK